MPLLPTPTLSQVEKDALIAALTARLALADQRIAAQDARIAALEARLTQQTQPPKTSGNSSKPPSQGQKPDLPAPGTDRPPRKSHPGVGRTLHPNPDRTIHQRLATCPKCAAAFPDASQTPQQVYERIELPPVRPDVTQVRLFGGRCACCGERVTASPSRSGARFTIRPIDRSDGSVSALRPCHRHGTAVVVDGRTVLTSTQ